MFTEYQISFLNLFQLILRLFLNQSCDKIAKSNWNIAIKSKINLAMFYSMIIVWMFSALILTKAMTGLLLKTYSRVEFVPLIDDLGDITLKDDLWIASRHRNLSKFKNIIDSYSTLTTDILVEKTKSYEKVHGNFMNEADTFKPAVMGDMIKGKSVIITDTNTVESLFYIYHDYKTMFTSSDNKYLSQAGYFVVKKSQDDFHTIKFL